MRIPITYFMTGNSQFTEINFYTTGGYVKGYIEATFYTPDEGSIDLMFRVHDSENGKDNTLTWTSRPTKYSHWLEMILTSISRKSKLKEIIGMEFEDRAEISYIGYVGHAHIGSVMYGLDGIHGIKECYEHYYKGE